MIITTTDSKKNAVNIAKILIHKKIVACVQIDNVKSFFYYQSKCREDLEFRLMIKAPSRNYNTIERVIKSEHNYQLPQIIKFDITDGSSEYLEWVCSN